ncbi:MAG: SDR family oxidoreductase [Myxococcota bacterium]|nr:SDR family oxidoreductase [Myxococcota bacterium]
MKKVVVTGVTGTLGAALAEHYERAGWSVTGVSRKGEDAPHCQKVLANAQQTIEDARALVAEDPDVLLLNAGQIEDEVGEGGLPLADQTLSIYQVNAIFPSLVAIAAAESRRPRRLDVVCIGSIADGAPSSFGPVYHASKIAAHYFYTGVGPIASGHDPNLRLRLYRPGAIQGPLSWAPAIRLNERGRKIRAKRCESAPEARYVAMEIARFVEGNAPVGTWDEPFSFRALRVFFAVAPGLYARVQKLGWKQGSRFA